MSTTQELVRELNDLERQLYIFRHLEYQVYLDATTAAPPDTAEGRGITLEYLNNLEYETFTSTQTANLLHALSERGNELSARQRRQVEFLQRSYTEMVNIPQQEYVDFELLMNDAQNVWHKAKNTNDFAAFAPYLKRIVDSQIRFAAYWDGSKDPYDVLLNRYERGMDMKMLDDFFAQLKEAIIPLVKRIQNEAQQINNDFLKLEYPLEKQRELSNLLMEVLTIDRNHCGIAETEHPYTLEFDKDDVRITTHYYSNNIMSSFYSVMHEGGHATYELNTSDDLRYTSLATGASSGMHESQSRFYENMVGRSKPFIHFIFPKLQQMFPEQLNGVSEQQFYLAVNRSEPTLIRINSDELTYCLHIIIRYEIEKLLIHREVSIEELPAVWAEKVREYLGIEVPDDTHGVLQDSHWSGGSIGYFPTYALGNAYAAQINQRMKKDLDPDVCAAEGNLKPIVNWLSEHMYQYGCMYDPSDLFEKICGEPFTPQPYIAYLTEKFSTIYGLK